MPFHNCMKHLLIKATILNKATLLFGLIMLLNVDYSAAQKGKTFTGILEYKITSRDTSLRSILPDNSMYIYTNDTIMRMENFTDQLGMQVTIKHMEKNKSYLLLNTVAGKFAIQTDLSAQKDTSKHKSKYTFKKRIFKRKFLGMKANRIIASHPDLEEPIEFLYFKKILGKYNPTFEEIPGLPVRYSVVTADGVIDYELTKINRYTPNRDLFGVPSDFERVTFDEFLSRMIETKNGGEIIPEE